MRWPGDRVSALLDGYDRDRGFAGETPEPTLARS